MGSTVPSFDFIVVGAGPAGVMVATRLANSSKQPSVLLIEAGGTNESPDLRVDGDRWVTRMAPGLNYNYVTESQPELDDRTIMYDRGRGLGGSSAINFSCWSVPPRDDFETISELTGDEQWRWKAVRARFNRIEAYHGSEPDIPSGVEKYLKISADDHGKNGPIKIGFASVWEKSSKEEIDAWTANGHRAIPGKLSPPRWHDS